jgi:hypothetical protein
MKISSTGASFQAMFTTRVCFLLKKLFLVVIIRKNLHLIASKCSAISAFYIRIKPKKGTMVAIKATAGKIAILYYNIRTKGIEFVEKGIYAYPQQKIKANHLKRLHQQAKQLGLKLLPMNK